MLQSIVGKYYGTLAKVLRIAEEQGCCIAFRQVCFRAGQRLSVGKSKSALRDLKFLLSDQSIEPIHDAFRQFWTNGLLEEGFYRCWFNESTSDKSVSEIEKLVGGRLTLFGGLEVQYPEREISWLHDPVSGFDWPSSCSATQVTKNKPIGTDIKTLWEPARFQFLSSLLQYKSINNDHNVGDIAFSLLDSWIKQNPFMVGPHWARGMEASIRLCNCASYLPLLHPEIGDGSKIDRLTRFFIEHLVYIRHHLEWSPAISNNHYLANLVALLAGRLIFPGIPIFEVYADFAEQRFSQSILDQFRVDGINFEGSLPYHRLAVEIAMFGVLVLKATGRKPNGSASDRLNCVKDFTCHYSEACNEVPLIGDNDSGVFVRYFPGQEGSRHTYLSKLLDLVLAPKCSQNSNRRWMNSVDQLGDENVWRVKGADGLVVAVRERDAVFFNTLRNGLHGSGGHTHNDCLSIYPYINRISLFVDRGSYTYTGDLKLRHIDRSVLSHNGPVLNDWEQNRIYPNKPFDMGGGCISGCDWQVDNYVLTVSGWHAAYSSREKGIRIYRTLVWNCLERCINVTDKFVAEKKGTVLSYQCSLLLHPIWGSSLVDNGVQLNCDQITARMQAHDDLIVRVQDGEFCPNYQVRHVCQRIFLEKNLVADETASWSIYY